MLPGVVYLIIPRAVRTRTVTVSSWLVTSITRLSLWRLFSAVTCARRLFAFTGNSVAGVPTFISTISSSMAPKRIAYPSCRSVGIHSLWARSTRIRGPWSLTPARRLDTGVYCCLTSDLRTRDHFRRSVLVLGVLI